MKHTPATPLPWALSERRTVRIAQPYSMAGKDDRKYLVHAANAYPRLVEALLLFTASSMGASNSRGETSIGWQQGDGATAQERVDAARALLRELGELS